jgi:UDP-N-acetylmuramyl pentapeptide synthase
MDQCKRRIRKVCFAQAQPLLATLSGGVLMKRMVVLALAISLVACKVEKTGQDTYKVVAPTPEAKAAGEKAKEEAKEAGQKIKQGTADAAVKVGGALKKAGEKAKTETAEATSTVQTETTTKTETRSKTKKRY